MLAGRMRTGLALGAALALTGPVLAEEPPVMPERFQGMVATTGASQVGTAPISITVERWSTADERKALVEALKTGGTDGLLKAMEGQDVGYIQVANSLGYRLRVASSWKTDKGRVVRVATDRPIKMGEVMNSVRSLDYPIGVIEFVLPPEGSGDGALLLAAKVRFDEQGRLEVESLPQNTGPQKLMGMTQVAAKKKKSKEKTKS